MTAMALFPAQAPPTDTVLRHQRVFVYITAVLAMLAVEICACIPPSPPALRAVLLCCATCSCSISRRQLPSHPISSMTARDSNHHPGTYWTKSKSCCSEIRALLGCDPFDFSNLCLEFPGDCADLAAQFPDIPNPDGSGGPAVPPGYECRQFPDDRLPGDKISVAFVMTAIAFGTKVVLMRLFSHCNEIHAPEVRGARAGRRAMMDGLWPPAQAARFV